MQEIDRYTIETVGIPSLVLMERAALAAAETILNEVRPTETILVVCGMGNNGGDGAAAARILAGRGRKVRVLLAGEEQKASGETKHQLAVLERLGFRKEPWFLGICGQSFLSLQSPGHGFTDGEYTVIIDALFGTGLTREVRGEYRKLMDWIQTLGARVYSIDIPSGVHASTGQVLGRAVRADVTVTLGYGKLGLYLYPGAEYAGRIVTAEIGFPEAAGRAAGVSAYSYEPSDLPALLPKRRPDSHKGTYGKVLVIAGSKNMCGAAYFAAKSALRTGAGLVKTVTWEENRGIMLQKLPETVLETYRPEQLLHREGEFLQSVASFGNALVFGPGMGTEDTVKQMLLWLLEHTRAPLVVDADGLNVLSKLLRAEPEKGGVRELLQRRGSVILTPHWKEMQRLSGDSTETIQRDQAGYARAVAKDLGVILVLKSARTVVSDGQETYINVSGNSGMSAGGSGDVLSGMIGGLLAQGMSPMEAAKLGVYLHGRAGDCACKKLGPYAMTAEDLMDGISGAFTLSVGKKERI